MNMQAQDDTVVTIAGLMCFLVAGILLFGALGWSLIGMRRGLVNSNNAIRQVEESLILSRRSVEIQEEALKQQEEVIRLLREICNHFDPGKYKSTQSK
jgi:hypothetical protein